VGGEHPSQEDTAVFSSLKSVPDRKKYPNLYFYYCTLCNFTQGAIQGFKGEAKAEKKEEKKEEKKVEKKKEEDDIDLFGDDNEEDKAVLAKVAEKQKAEQEKKKEKKAVIAKSIIVFDVKVYDTEQDLKALAEKIFKEVNMDGLVWNKDVKIVPIAFGMNKL
jgi:elongation factor 1-beta